MYTRIHRNFSMAVRTAREAYTMAVDKVQGSRGSQANDIFFLCCVDVLLCLINTHCQKKKMFFKVCCADDLSLLPPSFFFFWKP